MLQRTPSIGVGRHVRLIRRASTPVLSAQPVSAGHPRSDRSHNRRASGNDFAKVARRWRVASW
jgi:hypothetical protein